jgi:predicted metal-dependent HD superfamily phosphohydrolase
MDYSSILEQARHYVKTFFDTHVNENLYYHNRYHTEKVVETATMIAQHYQLNDRDFFIVNLAAMFHDIGYLTGGAPGHEERGAGMAEAFLAGTGVEPGVAAAIRQCILATQLPQRPNGLLDEIVCDADLFHFGTDEFSERNKLMRKETEAVRQKKISKEEWRRGTIRLLEAHHYHTDYCRLLLDGKKQENLAKLKTKELESEAASGGPEVHVIAKAAAGKKPDPGGVMKDHGGILPDALASLLHEHDEEKEGEAAGRPATESKKKNKKKQDPGRGIDTVFRITSNNNQRLSTQADSKAHILIQVNSIIISVLLSLLLRKIEDHANLAIPTIILLTVNLVTIILSILATRPHIPAGTFTKADLDEKKVNLLFFGNFYKMSLEEYAGGMLVMMDDRDFLYGSLIRDVYYQGIALGKKYRWLRLSYNVFMFGLIGSVLAFVVAALLYGPK